MLSEQSRPLWTDVHEPEQLEEFLRHNFERRRMDYYLHEISMNLQAHSYRLENELYLPFAARMLLIAAEFQFPGVSGHIGRHSRHHWKRDFMSPVHLLALGTYMAKHTVLQFDNKAKILDSWRYHDRPFLQEWALPLISSWVRPPNGVFPDTDAYLYDINSPYDILGGRLDVMPIFIPDIPFLRQVASIPLNGDQADHLSEGAFQSQFLRTVQRRIFPASDPEVVADLFINDPDTWSVSGYASI